MLSRYLGVKASFSRIVFTLFLLFAGLMPASASAAPDLVPAGIQLDSAEPLGIGELRNVSFTIANQGTDPAGSRFYYNVVLSPDAEISATDISVHGGWYYNTIAAGGSVAFNPAFRVPHGLAPGDYYIGVVVDQYASVAESDESNNTVATTTSVYRDIDLVPANVVLSAIEPMGIGELHSISFDVQNLGATATNSRFYYSVVLSTDAEITAADINVFGDWHYNYLAPGESVSLNPTFRVPHGTEPGNYYVGIIVDRYASVPEIDEVNNTASVTASVYRDIDLTPANVVLGTAAPMGIGELHSVSFDIQNLGATATNTRFYYSVVLSTDADITAADINVFGDWYYNYLTPGGSVSFNPTFRIPHGMEPGNYYVGIVVDRYVSVPETDEINNTASVTASVYRDIDLTVANLVLGTVDPMGIGETHSVSFDVQNLGATATNSRFYYNVVLSTDTEITTADTIVYGNWYYNYVDAGGSVSFNPSFLIPNGLAPGDYYVGIIVDRYASVPETDETNNTSATASAASVVYREIDLVPTNVVLNTAEPMGIGELHSISFDIQNLGGTATNSRFYYSVVLSTDAEITASDINVFGNWYYNYMAAGESVSFNPTFRVPHGTAPGNYYVGILVDRYQSVPEGNESNNTASVTGSVYRDIDLVPTNLVLSTAEPMGIGELHSVSFDIENRGATATNSRFYYTVVLSSDAEITASDINVYGNWHYNYVATGDRVSFNPTFRVPHGTPPGDYYVGVLVDRYASVPEIDETNNTVAVTSSVYRDIDLVPINVVLSTAEPMGIGELHSVSFDIENRGATATNSRFYYSVVLSDDAEITASDTVIHGNWHYNYLATGERVAFNPSFRVPHGMVPGDYHIGILVDRYASVPEIDESNNTAIAATSVYREIDLIAQNLTADVQGQVSSGQVFNVNATVLNSGATATNDRFHYAFYLSRDTQISRSDTYIGGAFNYNYMSAGQSINLPLSVRIPTSLPSGTYYLGVLVDTYNTVYEINENNNTGVITPALNINGTIDATLSSADISFEFADKDGDGFAAVGEVVTVLANVHNLGTIDINAVGVAFRTSTGASLGTTQIAVPAGGSAVASVPAVFNVIGDYTIEVVVDGTDILAEVNEGNNLASSLLTITAASIPQNVPDLAIGWADVRILDNNGAEVVNPQAGQALTVNLDVHNVGTAASVAGLSVSLFLDGAALPVQTAVLGSIAAGATGSIQLPMTAPATDGFHVLRVVVAADAAEVDRDNNDATRSFVVGHPGAGNAVIEVALNVNPAEAGAGALVTVTGSAEYVFDNGTRLPVLGAEVDIAIIDHSGRWMTHTTAVGNYARSINAPAALGGYQVEVTVNDSTLQGSQRAALDVITVCAKDLVVYPWRITPAKATAGVAGDVSAYVENVGTSALPEIFSVVYEITDASGQVVFSANADVTGMAAKSGVNVSFGQWTPPAEGLYSARVSVDPDNLVFDECNEANNASTRQVTVYPEVVDLSITNLNADTLSICDGASVTFRAQVVNQGGLDAASASVGFSVDGIELQGSPVATTGIGGQGGYLWTSLTWMPPAMGTYEVCATVDDAVAGNNQLCRSMTFSAGGQSPDLVLHDIYSAPIYIGREALLRVDVNNVGCSASSADAAVGFYIDGGLLEVRTLPAINPGARHSMMFSHTFDALGLATVRALATDPADTHVADNERTETFRIHPMLADLHILSADIQFSNNNPQPGETIEVQATIHNIGIGETGEFVVTFLENEAIPVGGEILISQALAPGQQMVVSQFWTPSDSGTYVMMVHVAQLIPAYDPNESDNAATRAIIVINPDSDGDGLFDDIDACPFEAPEAGLDADGDGCTDDVAGMADVINGIITDPLVAEPLHDKLGAISAKLESGESGAAVNQLYALVNQIHALVNNGSLTIEEAALLEQYVNNMINLIESGLL